MLSKFGLKIGYVLWGGFGLLLAIMVLQGGAAVWSLMHVVGSTSKVIDDVSTLSTRVDDINRDATAGATEVNKLSDGVQTGLVQQMKDGEVDLKLLDRSVNQLVSSTGAIIEQLESVLDDDQLDFETAGVIEVLLFEAEDNYDKARKESLPVVE